MLYNVTVERGTQVIERFSYDATKQGGVARGIQRGFRQTGHTVSLRQATRDTAFTPLDQWSHTRSIGSTNPNIHSGEGLGELLKQAGVV